MFVFIISQKSRNSIIFINGKQVAQSTAFTIKPADFRIYNYAMTADEVATLYDTSTDIQDITKEKGIEESTDSNDILGQKVSGTMKGIIILNGKKNLQK